jgi:DUF4097 and DUF4098 domain-containing protein YvlB
MPVFDTPDPITATLELLVGDVRITAGDRPDTVVEVRPSDPGTDLDVKAAELTRIEYADGRLLVKAPKQRGLGLFGKPGSVDVEIALPTGSRLDATTAVAKFTGTGTLGDVRVKTAVGDLRLDRTGPLDLKTSTGDIIVTAVAGRADLSTASGLLRVGEVDGEATLKNANGDTGIGMVTGPLKVSNSNGDVQVGRAGDDVTATTANGSVRIGSVTRGAVSVRTAFGQLEVGIPHGTAAYLDLHTSFGNVQNRLDGSGQPGPGEQIVEVRARTGYGDVVIRRPAEDGER